MSLSKTSGRGEQRQRALNALVDPSREAMSVDELAGDLGGRDLRMK
jgi:hypothetical protein